MNDEQTRAVTERAVRAAVTVARSHGLTVTDPEVLKDGSNVVVWLRPAPVVARVATTTALVRTEVWRWLRREVSVVHHLRSRGAAVVPPSELIPPGPYQHDGAWLSCWRYVEHDPEYTPGPAELTAAIAALHTALADYPGPLPFLGLVLDEIPRLIELADALRLAAPADVELMRAELARLRPALVAQRAQARPIHGDAHPGNVLATETGLLWNDFEDVCAGPAEWDHATAARGLGIADPPQALELCLAARDLQGVAWTLLIGHRFPERRARAAAHLDAWRAAAHGSVRRPLQA